MLPCPYQILKENEAFFQRGTSNLIASAPGVGKSIFMQDYMMKAQIPAVYFSMDTPRHVFEDRAAMMAQAQGQEYSSDFYSHLGLFFRTGVTAQETILGIGAYAEIHGQFPHLVVIDNLKNTAGTADGELARQQEYLEVLDVVAKEANLCAVVLHHVQAQYNSGLVPIPKDGIKNQLIDLAHLVLTITRSRYNDELLIATVKNRTGPDDCTGQTRHSISVNYDTLELTG